MIELPPGAAVLELRDALVLLRAVRRLGQLTERADGGGLSPELLAVAGALDRTVRAAADTARLVAGEGRDLRETQVNASAQVPDGAGSASLSRDLSAADVSKLLGCGPANVRDLAKREALRGRKVGGRWTFRLEDALEAQQNRR